jgi:RHS repeat-associated protein
LATGVTYDNDGNQTAGFGGLTFSYDAANRMTAVGGAASEAYAYDAQNLRVYSRNASGAEAIYFYGADGKKLATYTYSIITYGGSPEIQLTQQSANVYFLGKLISAEGNAVQVDGLGSVRSGGPGGLGHQAQYPYGVEYSATANDREKYATYTRDSVTGLDYAMNRYYTSQWGRFLSPDPMGHANPGSPQSWNQYAYVDPDPVNGNDPSGLMPCLMFADLTPAAYDAGGWYWDGGWIWGPELDLAWDLSQVSICSGEDAGLSPFTDGSGGPGAGPYAKIMQKVWAAYRLAESLLTQPDCAELLGQGTTPGGATVPASQVLTDLMNGSPYGSISAGPPPPSLPPVNAWAMPVTIGNGTGATWNGADIGINAIAGDYVNGTVLQQVETLLHELGHAMNFIFGNGTSGIGPDGPGVKNGTDASLENTVLVDLACIKLFVPPPPVLLPGPPMP